MPQPRLTMQIGRAGALGHPVLDGGKWLYERPVSPLIVASPITADELVAGREFRRRARAFETPHCPPGHRGVPYTEAYLRLVNRR